MNTKTILKTIRALTYALVFGTPLVYWKWSVYPQVFSKLLFFEAFAGLIVVLWVVVAIAEPAYRPRKTPLLYALGACVLILLVSAFTGADATRSLWSTQERAFGVVAIVHLAGLFAALSSLKSEIDWRKVWWWALAGSAVVSAIAFVQLKLPEVLLTGDLAKGRPGSTFGNPTFMAGYLLFTVFIALWLFAQTFVARAGNGSRQRTTLTRAFLALIVLLNIGAIFLSATRGAFLGFVAGAFVIALYFIFVPVGRSRAVFGSLLAVAALVVGIFFLTRSSPVWGRVLLFDRLQNFSFSSEEFTPRRIALMSAWQGFLERPALGWGWDNFNITFNKHYDPRSLEFGYQETRFDKPHNAFMEYLNAGGIVLVLAVMVLLAVFAYELWVVSRRASREHASAFPFLAGAVVAYAVFDLTAFDTLSAMLILFLILAWTDARFHEAAAPVSAPVTRPIRARTLALLLGWGVIAYFIIALPAYAAHYQYWGFMTMGKNPSLGTEYFTRAAETGEPYQWQIKRDFALIISETYFYNPGVIPDAVAWKAVDSMRSVVREHAEDAYNHYALVDMLNQVSALDPRKLLPEAEEEANVVLTALSPNRQEVLFSLAKTKSLEGKNDEALAILERAIALSDKVPDAHFYYGLIAYTVGKPELGYQELARAMQLGRPWKNYYEPRTAGNFFANSGHLAEAVQLYQAALRMEPNDLESRIKLGMVYFLMGNRDAAREQLTEVARRYDLTKSPMYSQLRPVLDELGIVL